MSRIDKKMRCQKCKKEVVETLSLTKYGRSFYRTSDDKEYCEDCFDKIDDYREREE